MPIQETVVDNITTTTITTIITNFIIIIIIIIIIMISANRVKAQMVRAELLEWNIINLFETNSKKREKCTTVRNSNDAILHQRPLICVLSS
jgi:hypothetical protein